MQGKEIFISGCLKKILLVNSLEINEVVERVDDVMKFISTHSVHLQG